MLAVGQYQAEPIIIFMPTYLKVFVWITALFGSVCAIGWFGSVSWTLDLALMPLCG